MVIASTFCLHPDECLFARDLDVDALKFEVDSDATELNISYRVDLQAFDLLLMWVMILSCVPLTVLKFCRCVMWLVMCGAHQHSMSLSLAPGGCRLGELFLFVYS